MQTYRRRHLMAVCALHRLRKNGSVANSPSITWGRLLPVIHPFAPRWLLRRVFPQPIKPGAVLGLIAFMLIAAPIVPVQALGAQDAPSSAAAPPTPAQCGIPGHHALLERMTNAFLLSCEQQLKIEPLLHDEESLSKPLIRFAAFAPDEKKAVMKEVKVAARHQILPLLTPDQQKKMDEEIETVSEGGEGLQKGNGGGSKGGKAKKTEPAIDPFLAEESLSQAISNYSALSDSQKKELILKVKKASLRADAPPLTPEQVKKIDSEIQRMSS